MKEVVANYTPHFQLDPVPEVQLIPIEHEGHTLLEVKVKTGTLTPYYYIHLGRQ